MRRRQQCTVGDGDSQRARLVRLVEIESLLGHGEMQLAT